MAILQRLSAVGVGDVSVISFKHWAGVITMHQRRYSKARKARSAPRRTFVVVPLSVAALSLSSNAIRPDSLPGPAGVVESTFGADLAQILPELLPEGSQSQPPPPAWHIYRLPFAGALVPRGS